MNLTRTIRVQLAIFTVVALVVILILAVSYMRLPAVLFGVGNYNVKLQLAESGYLYPSSNVTYRGVNVGTVTAVTLTDTGVEANLQLNSDFSIPSDLDAQVRSQTAIGEQYVALIPRGDGPALRNGDVISRDHTSVPPNISALLDAANRGVEAIPNDDFKTVVDESYTAFGGLGPEFRELVDGATSLAIDADKNRDALVALIEDSKPVLDSQTDTSDSVQSWAANLATVTDQLRTEDSALAGLLEKGPGALEEARSLVDELKPTLPTVLANLVSVEKVAIVYQPAIEQLLVLLPMGVSATAAGMVPGLGQKTDYRGFYLSFNLNLNLPPPCTTGFLPTQQKRGPAFEDAPPRVPGDVYCRTPQDGMFNVRGAKNYPCLERPGKRAPTVAMCLSDEEYVPLNDGYNWKGDPNATLSGQDIPQLPPGSPPSPVLHPAPPAAPPVPIAAAEYDPASGQYVGPDGKTYTQSDLAQNAPQEKTWRTMLIPPGS